MDQRIYFWHKLCFFGSQYWAHIQVCIQRKDHQNTLVNKCKHHYYIEHLDHKVKDCMDHLEQAHVLIVKNVLKINLEYKKVHLNLTWRWFWITACEWIASILIFACANWSMIDNFTSSIISTRPWTRISTFFVHTCSIRCTLRMRYAFRSTIWWRSNITRKTRTRRRTVRISTLCIWSTRWRETGVVWNISRWQWS